MGCRGVFFALTAVQEAALLSCKDDEAVLEVIEGIEEEWNEDNLVECDKAWDAMHRALTDGQLANGNGKYPMSHCVVGPRQLHQGDDYIVSLVTPKEVKDVASALAPISEDWFKDRYETIVPKDYAPEYGDIDRDYTWEYFKSVRELYARAAKQGSAVVFTVDQ